MQRQGPKGLDYVLHGRSWKQNDKMGDVAKSIQAHTTVWGEKEVYHGL